MSFVRIDLTSSHRHCHHTFAQLRGWRAWLAVWVVTKAVRLANRLLRKGTSYQITNESPAEWKRGSFHIIFTIHFE